MKVIFTIGLAFFSCFYLNSGQECALQYGGVIIQQISSPHNSSNGLFWSKKKELFYVDSKYPTLFKIDEKTGQFSNARILGIQYITASFPIKNNNKKQMALADNKLIYLNIKYDSKKKLKSVTTEDIKVVENESLFYISRGLVDAKGNLWADSDKKFNQNSLKGKLYRISPTKQIVKVLDGLQNPNGIGFSPDNKLFYQIIGSNYIYKYDFDINEGILENETIIFNIKDHNYLKGNIGAFTVSDDNSLWIGVNGSGQIIQYNWEKQEYIQIFKLPALFPISMAFGDENVLFIGTERLLKNNKADGSVYAITGHKAKGKNSYEIIDK